METWKEYNCTGYFVSDLGLIKSKITGKLLKPGLKNGYKFVILRVNGVNVNTYVHRLVWQTFKGSIKGLRVDHIDEDKLNNRLDNLQLLTNRQNTVKHFATKPKSSKYPGVNFCRNANKWRAAAYINGVTVHIGLFVDEIEAANAYRNALKNVA